MIEIRVHNENSQVPTHDDSRNFLKNEIPKSYIYRMVKSALDNKEPPSMPKDDKASIFLSRIINFRWNTEKEILDKMNNVEKNHVNRIHRYALDNIIKKVDISDEQSLKSLFNACCLFCFPQHDPQKPISENDIKEVMNIEHLLIIKVGEALGYWTNKLPQKINADKGNKTKQQQREIKEDYIVAAWLHITKDTNRKNTLMSKSLNKKAEEIYDYVLPLLKNKKTATGEYVLTRKPDKNGNIKYSGLSTDTIIDIMRNTKSDKIIFNPFKK